MIATPQIDGLAQSINRSLVGLFVDELFGQFMGVMHLLVYKTNEPQTNKLATFHDNWLFNRDPCNSLL